MIAAEMIVAWSVLLDPQDQIEVLLKAIVLCVKCTRQISVDLTAFYTSSVAGNAERQYVVLCSTVGYSNRSVDQLQAL
jgi:hypothetical protein